MKTLRKLLKYLSNTPPTFEGKVFTDEETAQGNNYFGSWVICGIGAVILVALMFA